ncbi:MAG: four-carbon acid sugar kinase family protein [Lachnospiraceae bacterium]|jgi:uncharacterized protein YgbK (DUF1537 family)
MSEETISASVLNQYPPMDEKSLDRLLAAELAANHTKFVVLDDDPTGVQTVHDVNVYTDWKPDSLLRGFGEDSRLFFVLTNSRGMTAAETAKIHREIIASAELAAARTGRSYQFISRSDSTLRGHYPLETELLREGMEKNGRKTDGEILFPFFKEGGRYTIDNTHYVRYGDRLVPAAQTEFARDPTFGYTHSDLPQYIEEKTDGRYRASDVVCVSLEDLRAGKIDSIRDQLLSVRDFGKVCVNAIDYCDVKVFCIALYRAMAAGKTFLYRTAASFVKVVGGISDRPLLTRKDMVTAENGNGGVVVVGSHTAKTTAQLEELLRMPGTVPVEFRSSLVLSGDDAFYGEVSRCAAEEEKIIRAGKTAVCFTERKLLTVDGDTRESALLRSVKISDGVQRLVGELRAVPSFVIAKGGITSSDVGTKALKVRCAKVLGQIRPGIPVWQTGPESRFPGTPYVIFPGNVGEAGTLREAVEILSGTDSAKN